MVSSWYVGYLHGSHWHKTRGKYFKSRAWKHRCAACQTTTGPFDLHHRTYARIGKEWIKDLVGLCRTCHRMVHRVLDRIPPRQRAVLRPTITDAFLRHHSQLAKKRIQRAWKPQTRTSRVTTRVGPKRRATGRVRLLTT